MTRADMSSRDAVREVLAATDIVDLVGGYVALKPAGGARLKGLCPFHNEDTPSFMVNRDRQTFHCFGCDRGGDAITFIQEHDGLTFPETLEKLADRAGIRLPAWRGGSGTDDDLRKKLLEFGKFAAKFFRTTLNDAGRGKVGREYLATRSLKPEIIEQFRLGYVPDEWSALLDAAKRAGFSEAVIEKSGLVKRGDRGSLYDLFRNRVIFPIRDIAGNVVAFGGRDLGDSPAKYINSPENPVYKKSRVLYGLHESREGLKRTGEAILVEGYFDLLRCFDAGIDNVVATCGTALTAEQAALIKRYVPNVLVVFDGDAAGIKAAIRSVAILTGAGLTVKPLVLPDGKDPDDFIKEAGREEFLRIAEQAGDFVSFYVVANETRAQTIEGRTEIAAELFEIIGHIHDGLRRDEYLKRLASELNLNAAKCREEFARYQAGKLRRRPFADAPAEPPKRPVSYDDRIFLASLLATDGLLERLRETLERVEPPEGPLAEILQALSGPDAGGVLRDLESDEARRLYLAATNTDETWGEHSEQRVLDRIESFRRESLRRQARQLQEAIERAQRSGEIARVDELVLEKITVEKEIREIGAA